MTERLYRSEEDVMLAGVCGGMAEHFDLDPSIVRLAWVLFGLVSAGTALILYLIAAIIIPKESELNDPGESMDEEDGETFTCEECGREFDSKRGLGVHQGQKH